MAKRTKLLAEEVNYICAQRNQRVAEKNLKRAKSNPDIKEEDLALIKSRLEAAKEKAKSTSEALSRAGLNKGSI